MPLERTTPQFLTDNVSPSRNRRFLMPQISHETAQKIAVVWDSSDSMVDAMRRAGIKTNDMRNMNRYRRLTEEMLGIQLSSLNPERGNWPKTTEHYVLDHEYTAVIYSDAHFWPQSTGPAFWILLELLEKIQPEIVIDNGDSWDGASISRHDPISFDHLPTLKDEYDSCIDHLGVIAEAAGEADRFRNIGNHDLRFEAKLAQKTPELNGMPGTTTSELFPGWKHNYSVVLNDICIVKHRWHCGVHAAWQNTLKAGVNIVTGHTHRLDIRPFTDYRGTRYGIETGTLADPYGPQFSYIEDNPRNWQEGFVVVTVDGDKIYPEKVEVEGNRARFRGEWIKA